MSKAPFFILCNSFLFLPRCLLWPFASWFYRKQSSSQTLSRVNPSSLQISGHGLSVLGLGKYRCKLLPILNLIHFFSLIADLARLCFGKVTLTGLDRDWSFFGGGWFPGNQDREDSFFRQQRAPIKLNQPALGKITVTRPTLRTKLPFFFFFFSSSLPLSLLATCCWVWLLVCPAAL
jgi:hypothetical protein